MQRERASKKPGMAETIKRFADKTHFKTCCPSMFQILVFCCHKQCHRFKLQSVETPDGLSASMYGLDIQNRHDSLFLSNNSPYSKQQEFVPDDATCDAQALIYSLCGDSTFPKILHIFGRYQTPTDGSTQAHCSIKMSILYEFAGWGMTNKVPCTVDVLRSQGSYKIFHIPVADYLVLLPYLSIMYPLSICIVSHVLHSSPSNRQIGRAHV